MKPPPELDERGAAKWTEILPELPDRDQGTLDALLAYCMAWSQLIEAREAIRSEGAVVRTPQGMIANPWVGIARQAQIALRQWGGELRLTPRTRRSRGKETSDPALRALRRA